MKKFLVIAQMYDGTTYCNSFYTFEEANADRNAVMSFYAGRVQHIVIK